MNTGLLESIERYSSDEFSENKIGALVRALYLNDSRYLQCNGTAVASPVTGSNLGLLLPQSTAIARTMPSSGTWSSVVWSGSLFCAVRNGSVDAATSTDGVTWAIRTLPSSSNWNYVAYGGGIFVAVSDTSAGARSTDGITWTASTLSTGTNWSSVAWNGTVFCAVSSGSANASTSTNGTAWAQRTLPSSQSWKDIEWAGTYFFAVASGTTSAGVSTDGITWTTATLPSSQTWKTVSWSGSKLCVAADTAVAAVSYDILNWTQLTTPDGYLSMVWDGYRFCAVGNATNTIGFSSNGITWIQRTLPTQTSWLGIASTGSVFSVVGASNGATVSLDTTVIQAPSILTDGIYQTWLKVR